MKLPPVSALQIAVIEALGPSELSGKELRARLRKVDFRKSLPAFYQLMARMEKAGLVSGEYEEKMVNGHKVKERRYRLLGEGEKARRAAREFYSEDGVFGSAWREAVCRE